MKNLINRALVAEKRLFFIFTATLMMTANLMAEDVVSNTRLVCIDNTFYYGKQVINKDQILNWYAQQNCQAAYNQYKKGQKMATAGWICLGIGGALDIGAGICYGVYAVNSKQSNNNSSKAPFRANTYSSNTNSNPALTAAVFLSVGAAAFEIACVPLLVVGYHKMHNSADIYNVVNATAQANPYWTFQASQDGLGLALKF